jgi:glycosyltransferase involved in cell wall biosynthesis
VRTIDVDATGMLELPRRIVWQALELPQLVRRERFDALISMSGMLPRDPGCPVISMLGNPVMYEQRTPATLARRWAVRRTAGRGARLVAPSGLMAELVFASVHQPCLALPWGVDHDAFAPATVPGADVLCVADFYAHKRHDLIIAAWRALAPPRPRLRFIGNPDVDLRAHARVLTLISELPRAEREQVVLERGLSLRELAGAYRDARVFVIASEHESFCMPLAEAMACGVPAVARDIPSLRETGGDGAAYVRGDDPALWAERLADLIDRDDAHGRARERAIAAAARFSWDAVAEGLVALL